MAGKISILSSDVPARLAAYMGLLAAYLAAVRNDPSTPFQLAFFGAVAGWSLGFEIRFQKLFFSVPIKIGIIALGAAVFVLFIAGNGEETPGRFANLIARFLFWNGIVFILSRNKTEVDFWTLALIDLSLFLISGSFVQPPFFLPLLFFSVACLLFTFLRAALLKCGPSVKIRRGGMGLAAVTLSLVLAVAVIIFVAFPRGLFPGEKPPERTTIRKPTGVPVATSAEHVGIEQFLKLTNIQKLKTDFSPVLRLRARDLQDRPLAPEQIPYLRGAVFERYEQGEWRNDFKKQIRHAGEEGWIPLDLNPDPNRLIVRQQILTSAIAKDLTFALPDPVRVQWAWKEARYDARGVLFYPSLPGRPAEYLVESALMPVGIPPRGSEGPPPEEYLQLPPGLERVREIARKQTENLEGRHTRASRLAQYLRRNGFGYKLDPFVPVQGKDPVEHFLEIKAGYCAHYATALALLCRAAGVPARVATGFQLREPEADGSFIVKNSDAHAWVEVWFGPDHGWRAYDATPGELQSPTPEGPPVASIEDRKKEEKGLDRWDRFIVDFDDRTFSRGLQQFSGALARAGRRIASPAVAATLVALALLAAVLYSLLPRNRRNRIRQLVSGFRETTSVDFYQDFLWTLSRRSIHRHPALTAREFARQVRAAIPDEGIDYLTEKFHKARFRGTPPRPEEREKIDAILARISKAP
jgi:transglutaminase-like putative cysteine protease